MFYPFRNLIDQLLAFPRKFKATRLFALGTCASLLVACGDGTPPFSNPNPQDQVIVDPQPAGYGVFLDSAVGGLGYVLNPQGHTGTTDAAGLFPMRFTGTITFSIGDLVFPEVPVQRVMTPLELFGTDDPTDRRVVNIIRLLQTLDEDGDPTNGIMITEAARNGAAQLNFDQPVEDFAADTEVLRLIRIANQITPVNELISGAEATDHFMQTLSAELSFESALGVWTKRVVEEGTLSLLIVYEDDVVTGGMSDFARIELDTDSSGQTSGLERGIVDVGVYRPLGDDNYLASATGVVYYERDGGPAYDAVANMTYARNIMVFNDSPQDVLYDRVLAEGLEGLWVGSDSSDEYLLSFAFLPDNQFVLIDDETAIPLESGVEWGTYSLDDQGIFSLSELFIDGNGDAGLSGLEQDGLQAQLSMNEGSLSLVIFQTVPETPLEEFTFERPSFLLERAIGGDAI